MTAFAQLEVKKGSFKEVPGFVNINTDKMDDDNNVLYAVIKVNTVNINDKQRHQLLFQGNAATFIELEYHVGEVWVYLSSKPATYLKISHPDFGSTEFWFPYDLKPKQGYEMVLVNKTSTTPDVVYNYLVVTADRSNAAVYIDDVFEGEQYAQKSFIAGEKHSWRIECELYHTESGEAVIPDKEGESIIVEKMLRPAFGYLNITSSPESGAIVYIDDNKVGVTPYTTDKLASGKHKVLVTMERYFDNEKTFTVTDGNTIQAHMTMMANFVNVNIATDSESDIYIDNEFKGKGNWSGILNDGNHAFEARKASHRNSVKNIKLTLGKDENIVIPNPTPIYGTIDLSTDPASAKIIIDDKDFGTTPRVLNNLLIGTHELRIEKEGCAIVTKTITLDEANKMTINEKLQPGREISISTYGNGDKIFVDGHYVGISPLKVTLSFSEHEIMAAREALSTDLNVIKDSKDSQVVRKTITVPQTGGNTSVQLAFSEGLFSVSSSEKVQFSKGNLQYQASTDTWRFAGHQWDIIGDANKNISSTYGGWIDLFGWGTSGYDSKRPWMTNQQGFNYCRRDIAGTDYDWGVYNKISNGEGKKWRTLTKDEWEYVFNKRNTISGIRYAYATVNGVKGVILLPDNWSSSYGSLNNTNKGEKFDSNNISQTEWINKFEVNGAVFLPAAGYRFGTSVNHVGLDGAYWSASGFDRDLAYNIKLAEWLFNLKDRSGHENGISVRLVCPVEN